MLQVVQRNREAYLPLLLLADPSEEMVRRYLLDGELYAWLTEEDETVGVLHVVEIDPGVVEIKNIAVRELYQGQGHGKKLLDEVIKRLRERGANEVVVRTGNSSIGNLAFYQKIGFRMMNIEHDYFLNEYQTPIFENGIRCRDRVHLALPL
ncbi:MAG: GNAT family N-acetyltransferase [Tumebacillaceae bacterium]